jgi:hypothetical protein
VQARTEDAPQSTEARAFRLAPAVSTVALVFVLGAALMLALTPRLDTDLWWHLKAGQYIIRTGTVPTRDFMTFTFRGHAWTDHEWLSEVIMYGLYRLGGLWALIVFFAAVITATFALVYAAMRQKGIYPMLAAFMTAVAFMCSSGSWGPRIQMLSLFFLALYSLILNRYLQRPSRRLLIALPAIMLLWANIHGGFVLGLALIAAFIVGEWLNAVTGRRNLDGTQQRDLALALVASFVITIVNPHTFRLLLYPLTFVLPNAYTNIIQESASPNFHLPVMMIFEALLLILLASVAIARPRLNWTNLLILVGFTHLALSQVRNVPVWAVVVSPLVAMYLAQAALALRPGLMTLTPHRGRVTRRKATINTALIVLVLLTYVSIGSRYVNARALARTERTGFPVGAVRYMGHHRLPSRVFVSYSWGGYLLWHLFPRYRDYMDSRADTLFNNRILRDYVTMYSAAPGWRSTLDHYHVQDVLIERGAPLAQTLALDPRWILAYRDHESVLYTRR